MMIGPKKILEVGTYTGYATLCMAEGLTTGGSIDTIDHNEELADMQRRYFDQSPYGNQITQHLGEAKDILKTLAGPYDLVFLDADKENYPHYFDLIIDKLETGGVILSDNVLWSGKVLEKAIDEATSALDSHSAGLIRTVYDGIKGRKTLIVISHDLSTLRNADKILVFEKGRLVESGSHSELIGKKYYSMLIEK